MGLRGRLTTLRALKTALANFSDYYLGFELQQEFPDGNLETCDPGLLVSIRWRAEVSMFSNE